MNEQETKSHIKKLEQQIHALTTEPQQCHCCFGKRAWTDNSALYFKWIDDKRRWQCLCGECLDYENGIVRD